MQKCNFKEHPYFKGRVSIRAYDLNWNLIPEECQSMDNLIVDIGLNQLASVLIGESSITHCGVGYGTTEPVASDVGLEHEIPSRKPITYASRVGSICLFSTFFGTTDCNPDPSSLGWTECGLFTAETGEAMISRALFTNKILKNNTKRYYIDWAIEISGV